MFSLPSYHATKFAVGVFLESLFIKVAPLGVKVTIHRARAVSHRRFIT